MSSYLDHRMGPLAPRDPTAIIHSWRADYHARMTSPEAQADLIKWRRLGRSKP